MNRLLFAAARGARIETMCDEWEEDRSVMVVDLQREKLFYRIHPDDAHLQYGPISAALREVAANPSYELAVTDEFGMWSLLYRDWCDCRDFAGERDVSLFLLILAEALADEGL